MIDVQGAGPSLEPMTECSSHGSFALSPATPSASRDVVQPWPVELRGVAEWITRFDHRAELGSSTSSVIPRSNVTRWVTVAVFWPSSLPRTRSD